MASSSSSSVPSTLSLNPVSEKLSRNNFPLSKAQILATLRGAQLAGYLDGSIEKPLATFDVTKDGKTTEVPNPASAS